MNAVHEELLIEAKQKFRKALTSTGKTGHPLLAPTANTHAGEVVQCKPAHWGFEPSFELGRMAAVHLQVWNERAKIFSTLYKPRGSWALLQAGLLGRKLWGPGHRGWEGGSGVPKPILEILQVFRLAVKVGLPSVWYKVGNFFAAWKSMEPKGSMWSRPQHTQAGMCIT